MSKQWTVIGVVVAALALGAAAITWAAPDSGVEINHMAPSSGRSTSAPVTGRPSGTTGGRSPWSTSGPPGAFPAATRCRRWRSSTRGSGPGFRIAAISIDEGSPKESGPSPRISGSPSISCTTGAGHPAGLPDHRRAGELLLDRRGHHRQAGDRRARLESAGQLAAWPSGSWNSPRSSVAGWILGIETSCDETSAAVLRVEGGRALAGGPRHSVPGRPSDIRRRGARAGEPRARPHHRLGRGSGAGRGGHRPPAARWHRRDRRARAGGRAAGRGDVWQDARLQPRRPADRGEPSRRPSLRPVARRPGARAAVRRAAGERRAHHAARRAGLGRVPAAGPDAGRRGRRGVRQGRQAARPRAIRAGRPSSGWPAEGDPGGSPFPGRCSRSSIARGPTGTPSRSAGSRPPCSARSVARTRTAGEPPSEPTGAPRTRIPGRGHRRAHGQDRARRRRRWATPPR